MNYVIVGTCGNCGGAVVAQTIWSGSMPPPRKCWVCDLEARDYGPVMQMLPRQPVRTTTTTPTEVKQ